MGESTGVLLTPSILGPSPGLSIIRIWQGVVEICLRLTIAVSLREPEAAKTEPRLVRSFCPSQVCSLCTVGLAGTAAASETSLEGKSKAAGVFVVIFSCAAAVVEVLVVVLRFLNIGAINLQMRKFFIVVRPAPKITTKSIPLMFSNVLAENFMFLYPGEKT